MPFTPLTHPIPTFGFSAEYMEPNMEYGEFEKFLRLEFVNRHPGWDPRFGKSVRYDPGTQAWNYMFLLTGNVPEARSRKEAERKAKGLVRELGSGFKLAHSNPGYLLPEPIVRIWRWETTAEDRTSLQAALAS